MMIDPTRVTFRRGHDARYLNIDYDGTEIGHLRLDKDNTVRTPWADNITNRPLVLLAARLVEALSG